MTHELTTARLTIKVVTPAMVNDAFRTMSKEEMMKEFYLDEIGFEHYQILHEKGMETWRISMVMFILILTETNEAIGDAGYHTWNPSHARAEIFYAMRTDEHKQKGYMKEALSEIIKYGFSEMKLHRIQALISDYNTPTKKLLLHYNFQFEGTIREDYIIDGVSENSDCYSLLSNDSTFRS
jgi:[ribosomal protein S5]-alanine N-acetyltransferase